MYSEKIGNWADRRLFRGTTGEEDGRNPATWCHGSGGILLARIKMSHMVPKEMNSIIKEDIEKAYSSLIKYGGKRINAYAMEILGIWKFFMNMLDSQVIMNWKGK